VPVSHVLENGDQIEILTSKNQTPKLEWLKFTTTAKAHAKIKDAFKLEKSQHIEKGKIMVEAAIIQSGVPLTSNNLKKITAHYNLNNKDQLYAEVGMGFIDLKDINEILVRKSENKLVKYWNITFGVKKKGGNGEEDLEIETNKKSKIDLKKPFVLKENQDNVTFSLAKCCNPIPGDKVLGYLSTDDHVIIHKTDCPVLDKYISNQGEKVIPAEWTKFKKQSYLTRIVLEGFDRVGIVNQITNIISNENNINMRSVKFDTTDGIFKGELFLYIHSTDDLNNLISQLKKIKGIENVSRIKNLND